MGSAGFSRWPHFFDRLLECLSPGGTAAAARGRRAVVTGIAAAAPAASRPDPRGPVT
jgi:hypothetical protein